VPQEQDLLHEAAVPAIIIMTSVIAASLCKKKPSQTIKATTSTWRNLWQNVQI
jgi:hypothetical protein